MPGKQYTARNMALHYIQVKYVPKSQQGTINATAESETGHLLLPFVLDIVAL